MIHPENLSRLLSPLREIPEMREAYMVGGSVRDFFLERDPKDADILVQSDPEEAALSLARVAGGHFFYLDRTRSILRVVVPSANTPDGKTFPPIHYDISPLGPESLTLNLSHRDFTIDAIAISFESLLSSADRPAVIDPFGGLADLKSGRVRALSSSVFEDDPLRLIRAFRLSGIPGFQIETETLGWIRSQVSHISRTAPERIREELFAIFSLFPAVTVFEQMRESGLLSALVAEDQKQDIDWVRRMGVLNTLETVLQNPVDFSPASTTFLKAYLSEVIAQGISRKVLLKWIVLFGGCDPFSSSDRMVRLVGASRRFCLASTIENFVKRVITGLGCLEEPSQTLMRSDFSDSTPLMGRPLWPYRFFKKTGDGGIGAILIQGSRQISDRQPASGLLQEMLFWYVHSFPLLVPPLVTGDDLVQSIGLVPGPIFRRILDRVEEERAAGLILNREVALSRIRQWIKSGP